MTAEPSTAQIRLDDVSKTYQVADGPPIPALDHVDLTIDAGQTLAVTGPSGSGKSTLLYVVAGLERVDEGTVEVDGHDIARLTGHGLVAHRRRVAVIFQNFALLPALSILDNVLLPAMATGRPTPAQTERARDLLDRVGLGGRDGDVPGRLSGGQQQRVAICRALLADPVVVLADEPTGNLDSKTGGAVLDLLLDLARDRGTTLLVATHDQTVAAACGHRVRMSDGRLEP